jgi:hypothetical protein
MTELAAHKQNSVAISPEAAAATRLTTDQLALPGRVRTLRQSLLCLEFLRQPSSWLRDPQPTLLIVTVELLLVVLLEVEYPRFALRGPIH